MVAGRTSVGGGTIGGTMVVCSMSVGDSTIGGTMVVGSMPIGAIGNRFVGQIVPVGKLAVNMGVSINMGMSSSKVGMVVSGGRV